MRTLRTSLQRASVCTARPALPKPGSMPEVKKLVPPSLQAAWSWSYTPSPAALGNSSGTNDVFTTFLPPASMRQRSSTTWPGRMSELAV